MKRLIDHYLSSWKDDPDRKPLLLRGARQVGKTYAVRQLAKEFNDFVEINFELLPDLVYIFDQDLHPERIIKAISLKIGRNIVPKKTLLFFDEVQAAPKAILSLRYFYEILPELHVIAAGSLLDFTTQQIGMPVGRIISFYLHPLSFIEFLHALSEDLIAHEILNYKNIPLDKIIHDKLLRLLGEYIAIGGMPEVVQKWKTTKDALACFKIHKTLIDTYRRDFDKYARKKQIKYLNLLFNKIPLYMAKKFKFSNISQEYRKRELEPGLELLITAGLAHKVTHSAGNGIPIGAQADPDNFKIIFIDIGLAQSILGLNMGKEWILKPFEQFINKGEIVEAFVGQEILAYSYPFENPDLYYWQRESRSSQAEIDYLIQLHEHVIPIEVKSGSGTTLKSMHIFLENRPNTPYGIKFSSDNYSEFEKIISYPLYTIAYAIKTKKTDN